MNQRTGVDIIVPVYNALNDLKLCVESIKRHTDLSRDCVIFINDKSPDKDILPYLKSIEGPGIVVMDNEHNRGFSGTINRGLEHSDRDVILLNTDTIVTSRWVDKLFTCAYSNPAIGTVTPFSNNATLCSIPNFCQENEVPNGLTIDEYAQVIESCSLKVYPKISVAVGFCMFIKRELIDAVGLFDAKTFERGYGEENDFCWRAEQLGYHNVLCDDTYIYHSGSASFVSKEKMQLMKKHTKILLERYPEQMKANAEYVSSNPHQYLRDNVELYSKLKNGRKNILYMLHLDFQVDAVNNIGGTQFHVKDLTQKFRKYYNVFVLARYGEYLRLTVYLEHEKISLLFYVGNHSMFQELYSKQISDVLKNILIGFSIDAVHVHHIAGLSLDIFHIAKELGIPLVMTLHDYFFICPTNMLLENGKKYCGGESKNCTQCLHKFLIYLIFQIKEEKMKDVIVIGSAVMIILLLINVIPAIPTIIQKISNETEKDKVEYLKREDGTGRDNIYWFIFDECASFAVMEKHYNITDTKYRDFLEEKGFFVSDHSRNESGGTNYVLTNCLNLDYVVNTDINLAEIKEYTMNPTMFTLLQENDYSIYGVGDVEWLCDIKSETVDSIDGGQTIEGISVSEMILQNSIVAPFIIYDGTSAAKVLQDALDYFQDCSNISANNSRFYLSYYCAPHQPFLFDENGNNVSAVNYNNWDDPKYYVGQYTYIMEQMLKMIECILDNDPNCIIVVQSDHGPRFKEGMTFEEKTNILNAVYYRNEDISEIDGMSSVNTFRTIFNRLFGTTFAEVPVPYEG